MHTLLTRSDARDERRRAGERCSLVSVARGSFDVCRAPSGPVPVAQTRASPRHRSVERSASARGRVCL